MKKAIFLVIGWIVVIGLIVTNIITNPNSLFVNGTIILGWLLFMLQLTWNNSESFYMILKSYWFFIKNPDCIWNVQVEYSGDFGSDIFSRIDKVFMSQDGEVKRTELSNYRIMYRLDTLPFEIYYDKYTGKIRIQLEQLEISYRRSRKVIDEELSNILEQLSKVIKDDKSEYHLIINFKEFNPYYGFFIRRLNAKDIKAFNVKFNVENDKVTISKQSIEVYTTSLQKLNSFSKEYLSLSPR